jgi:SAM-dependent methyltransferase
MPAFRLEQLPEHVSSYTVNDISADELALAPAAYEKALFDVTGDVRDFAGQFDVVFSKTLLEHVADGEALHRNVLSLLKPGGIAFHMAPTLYALPFVLNRMMPETLSRSILFRFFPNRRSEKPKFPAYYSWCYGNRAKMNGMLQRVGYREVEIIHFYGHSYYERIPVLRRIERAWAATAARRDWSTFSSFVHLVARK